MIGTLNHMNYLLKKFSTLICSLSCVSLHVIIIYWLDLNLFKAQYNLGHCLQSQLWSLAKELTLRQNITANLPKKFLFEVSTNKVSGDVSAKNGTQWSLIEESYINKESEKQLRS